MTNPPDPYEADFRKSSFISNPIEVMPVSYSSQDFIQKAKSDLQRRTSIDKQVQIHQQMLFHFLSILERMEAEDKHTYKCRCRCIIS